MVSSTERRFYFINEKLKVFLKTHFMQLSVVRSDGRVNTQFLQFRDALLVTKTL